MGELLDEAREGERPWTPEEAGEALEGVVSAIRKMQYGRILVVRGIAFRADGKPVNNRERNWSVSVGRESTICTKVDEAGVTVGSGIAIVFDGKATSKKTGREYKQWSVACKKPAKEGGNGSGQADEVSF